MQPNSSPSRIPKFEILDPETFSRMTRELARGVEGNFDVLLVVKNGAMSMATTFCDEFNHNKSEKNRINDIREIKAVSYRGIGKRGKVKLKQIPDFIEGDRVLVIDDVSDSGRTLIEIEEYLQRFGCDVTVATLYIKPNTKYLPDFYLREINRWVVFPREARETITQLKKMMKSKRARKDKNYLQDIIKRISELNCIETL